MVHMPMPHVLAVIEQVYVATLGSVGQSLGTQHCLDGSHLQGAPGTGHDCPVTPAWLQSVSLQHDMFEMHCAKVPFWHAVSPDGHWQLPPGVGHTSPVSGQSPLWQQLPIGMHVPFAGQPTWPLGHMSAEHWPPVHERFGPQLMPHPPQFCGSLFVLAQYAVLAPASTGTVASAPDSSPPSSPASAPPSAPPEASSPASDALPSSLPPSLPPSEAAEPSGAPASGGPPHSVSPAAHPVAHVPCEQTCAAEHTWPHEPQFIGSFFGTHFVPHSIWPVGHAPESIEPSDSRVASLPPSSPPPWVEPPLAQPPPHAGTTNTPNTNTHPRSDRRFFIGPLRRCPPWTAGRPLRGSRYSAPPLRASIQSDKVLPRRKGMGLLQGRRNVLWGLSAAAAAFASRPALAGLRGRRALRNIRRLIPGTRLATCRLVRVMPVERGALPFELEDASGRRFVVEAHRFDPATPGIARAGAADVFLVNGGSGSTPTCEDHGLAAMELAAILTEQQAAGRAMPQLATIVERWASDPPPQR
jgi:hypothetical protein